MNPWFAKAVILVGTIAMIVIRTPHMRRSVGIKVVKSRRGPLEVALMTLVMVGLFLPLLWVRRPVPAFAEYPLGPIPFTAGILCIALGLWFLYRSHADLGTNWSTTLKVREKHQLVTQGVYRRIRHPMYLAFLLQAFGQALVVPNWVAGPSYVVAVAVVVALRVGPEERMMLEEFGKDYEAYMARTRRLVPGLW